MVDQVLMQGVQIATTVPEGPVYLTGAREVWDERAPAPEQPLAHWRPAQSAGLPSGAPEELSEALWRARKPLIITSYLGRQPEAARRLAELSGRIGIAVCEVNPQYVNCPGDHPNHVGYRRNALVNEADLILMLDVDVPWIVAKVAPQADRASSTSTAIRSRLAWASGISRRSAPGRRTALPRWNSSWPCHRRATRRAGPSVAPGSKTPRRLALPDMPLAGRRHDQLPATVGGDRQAGERENRGGIRRSPRPLTACSTRCA